MHKYIFVNMLAVEALLIEAKNIGKPLNEGSQTSAGGAVLTDLAPLTDWSEIGEPENFVQFYETDKFLLDSLSGFVGAGMSSGDACNRGDHRKTSCGA